MIHYDLRCAEGHEFDGWFRSSDAFDKQAVAGLLACPACGSTAVSRALMAPRLMRKASSRPATEAAGTQREAPDELAAMAVKTRGADAQNAEAGRREAGRPEPVPVESGVPEKVAAAVEALPDAMRAALQRLRAEVERRCDYVGRQFAEEVRAMHRGDQPHRPVYGEASPDQAEQLAEEGIDVARIPWVPRADG